MPILPTLSFFSLLIGKENQKKRMELPYLFLFFYIIIFRRSGELIQGSKMSEKGYDRVPWSPVFLGTPLPSFFGSMFWFHLESMASYPLSPLPLLTFPFSDYSVMNITHLPGIHFKCCWLPVCGSAWDSVLMEHHEQLHWGVGKDRCICYVYLLCSHVYSNVL